MEIYILFSESQTDDPAAQKTGPAPELPGGYFKSFFISGLEK